MDSMAGANGYKAVVGMCFRVTVRRSVETRKTVWMESVCVCVCFWHAESRQPPSASWVNRLESDRQSAVLRVSVERHFGGCLFDLARSCSVCRAFGHPFWSGHETGRFHVVTPALRLQSSLHCYTGLLHQPHDLAPRVSMSFDDLQWCGACSPGQAQGGALCSTKCK